MNIKNTKKSLLIVSTIFFSLLLTLCSIIFCFVSYQASGRVLLILIAICGGMVALLSFIISSRYANLNRKFGGDRKLSDYFREIWITLVLLILMSIAISFAGGMILNGIFGGVRAKADNLFFRGAIVKIPMIIIYLAAVYNMFFRQGKQDAMRRRFNVHLKLLAVVLTLIFMLPNAVFDSMYDTYMPPSLSALFSINVHTALSPNIDIYVLNEAESGLILNPDFNIIFVSITVVLTFMIEVTVCICAYTRGKQDFLKNRINEEKFETDDIISRVN